MPGCRVGSVNAADDTHATKPSKEHDYQSLQRYRFDVNYMETRSVFVSEIKWGGLVGGFSLCVYVDYSGLYKNGFANVEPTINV